MNNVISSRNFFIDTSDDTGAGDNAEIHLGSHNITCGDGQLIKLSLLQFDMYRNFYGVNTNNSKATVAGDAASGANIGSTTLTIPNKNYGRLGDLAAAFAEQAASSLLLLAANASAGATTPTTASAIDVLPGLTEVIDGTGDRLLSFSVAFDHPHNLAGFSISCDDDSYRILGGDRGTNSLDCSVTNANTLLIEGRYPMQLTTEHHVVLRFDKPSTNIESASFSQATGPYQTHVLASNILAVIPQDYEYCSYNSSTGEEYFAILSTRSLSALRLFLTDGRNRPLGRIAHSASKTAAGTGAAQSTLGNLSFRAVLRIDIIQATIPRTLQAKPFARTVDAKDTGVLTNFST